MDVQQQQQQQQFNYPPNYNPPASATSDPMNGYETDFGFMNPSEYSSYYGDSRPNRSDNMQSTYNPDLLHMVLIRNGVQLDYPLQQFNWDHDRFFMAIRSQTRYLIGKPWVGDHLYHLIYLNQPSFEENVVPIIVNNNNNNNEMEDIIDEDDLSNNDNDNNSNNNCTTTDNNNNNIILQRRDDAFSYLEHASTIIQQNFWDTVNDRQLNDDFWKNSIIDKSIPHNVMPFHIFNPIMKQFIYNSVGCTCEDYQFNEDVKVCKHMIFCANIILPDNYNDMVFPMIRKTNYTIRQILELLNNNN